MSNNSWKQYGGISQIDNFTTLNAGTIIADQFLSRTARPQDQTFTGTLVVGQDVIAGNSSYAGDNLVTGKHLLVNKKLFFFNTVPSTTLNKNSVEDESFNTDNDSYITGNRENIGINKNVPGSVFHIGSDHNSTYTDIVTIESSNASIRNILAQNMNQKGLVVESNDDQSKILFFHNQATAPLNIPDASIHYNKSNQTFLLDTPNNMQFSAKSILIDPSNTMFLLNEEQTVLDSSNQLLFQSTNMNNSQIYTSKIEIDADKNRVFLDTSGQILLDASSTRISLMKDILIDASDGNINIRSNNTTDVISREILVISDYTVFQDLTHETYLPNHYNDNSIQTGTPIIMKTFDNSSNVFLHFDISNTENVGGGAIGGGAFPADTSRTMTSIGINDMSGNYIPNQTIISSKNYIQYLTTLGINTYQPKSEQYIMDINGPVYVSNGEIQTRENIDFEIKNMVFGNGNYKHIGFAIGSPNSITSGEYTQFVYYSHDNGITWTKSNIYGNNNSPDFFNSSFIYDTDYIILGGSNNQVYFTVDGGINFSKTNHNNGSNGADTAGNARNVKNIEIVTKDDNGLRIYMPHENNGTNFLRYVEADNTSSISNNSILPIPTDISNTNWIINSSITVGDDTWFAGAGLVKLNKNTNYSTVYDLSDNRIKTTNTYNQINSINTINTTHIIAVGVDIVSYSTDSGTNWTDIIFENTTFNDIYLFDSLNSIIVGNQGKLFYSKSGFSSSAWTIMPDAILNTSGISKQINGPENTLTNIHSPNINTFIVSNMIQSYDSNTSQLGKSKIMSVFVPNLFNRDNNVVLDISGKAVICGDLDLIDQSRLYVTSTSLLHDDVSMNNRLFVSNDVSLNNRLFVGSNTIMVDDVSMNNRLFVSNDVSLNNRLFVGSNSIMVDDVSMNNRLFVSHDVSLNNRLFVGSNSIFVDDVSMNNRLFVSNDVSLNNRLFVGSNTIMVDDVSMNNRLFVSNDVSLNNRLFVGSNSVMIGDVSMNNRLFVGEDASFNKDVTILGTLHVQQYQNENIITTTTNNYEFIVAEDLSLNGRLFVKDDVSMNSKLYVENDTTLDDRLFVSKDVSLNNRLFVGSNTIMVDDVSMNNRLFVSNDVSLNNRLFVGSNTIMVDDVSMNNRLFVSNDVSLNNRLFVGSNTIMVDDVSMNNRLFVSNDVSLNNRLYVGSNTIMVDDVSMNNRLFVSNDVSLNNRLYVGSNTIMVDDVSMNNRLFVTNDVSLNNRLFVGSNSIFVDDVSMNNRLFVSNDVSLNNRLFVGSNTIMVDDVSMNNRLFVSNDVSLNNRLFVGSNSIFVDDVSMNNRLFVSNDVSLNNRLYVGSNTIMVDDVAMNNRLFVSNDVSLNNNLFVADKIGVAGAVLPKVSLDISATDAIRIPCGLSNERPTQLQTGQIRFNTDTKEFEGYGIDSWGSLGGVKDVDQNTYISAEDTPGDDNNELKFFTAGTQHMIIDSDGDVSMNGNVSIGGDLSVNNIKKLLIGPDAYGNSSENYTSHSIIFDISTVKIHNLITTGTTVSETATQTTGIAVFNRDVIIKEDISLNQQLVMDGIAHLKNTTESTTTTSGSLIVSGGVGIAKNVNIDGTTTINGDVSMNNRLFVSNDVSLNNRLFVGSNTIMVDDVSMNNRLFVSNDVSLNNRLFVGSNSIFVDDVSMNNRLFVSNDVSLNNRLFVGSNSIFVDDVSMNNRLFVSNDVSLNNRLFVGSNSIFVDDVSMNNRLFVSNDVSLNNRLFVGSNTIMVDDVSMNNRLFVSNDVSLNNHLFVAGKIGVAGAVLPKVSLDISATDAIRIPCGLSNERPTQLQTGQIRFNTESQSFEGYGTNSWGSLGGIKDVDQNTFISAEDTPGVDNNELKFFTAGTDNLRMIIDSDGDVSMNGKLNVDGDVSFNGDVHIFGDLKAAQINNEYIINTEVTNYTLIVAEDLSLNNRLFVLGDASFNEDVFVKGDVSMNQKLSVGGDVSMNGNLNVVGNASFNQDVHVAGDVSMNGIEHITYIKKLTDGNGTASHSIEFTETGIKIHNLTTTGTTISETATETTGNAVFNNNVVIKEDISLNNRLFMDGIAHLKNTTESTTTTSGSLIVSGGVGIAKNVNIDGTTTINGDVSMNNRLFVSNDVSLNNRLFVGSNSIFVDDVSMNNRLFVSNDVSLNNRLFVGSNTIMVDDVSMNNRLFVSNDVSLNNRLFVGSNTIMVDDVSMNNRLFVSNDASFNEDVYVAGNVGIGKSNPSYSLDVNGKALFGNTIGSKGIASRTLNVISPDAVLRVARNHSESYAPAVELLHLTTDGNTVNSYWDLYNTEDNRFSIRDRTSEYKDYVNILGANGNVGIGITNPSKKLDIDGDISLNSDLFMNTGGVIKFNVDNITLTHSSNTLTFGGSNSATFDFNHKAMTNVNINSGAIDGTAIGTDAPSTGKFTTLHTTIDASFNNRLFVSNDVSLNNRLFVGSNSIFVDDVSMNNRLFVSNDVSLNNRLFVGSNSIFVDDVSMNNRLFVSNDVSLNNRLFVGSNSIFVDDVSMNNRLFVSNDVSFNNRLFVGSNSIFVDDVSMNNRLFVSNDVSLNNHLFVAGKIGVDGDVSMNNRLFVGEDASFNNDVFIVGGLSLNQKLSVGGDASFNGDVHIFGDLKADKYSTEYIINTETTNYSLIVAEDLSLNNRLFVLGDASFNEDVFVAGNVGIGTKTPSAKLHIHQQYADGGLYSSGEIKFSTNNSENHNWQIASIGSYIAANNGIHSDYPGGLVFKTKAPDGDDSSLPVDRMVIDSNGNVGIGTTGPDAKLHLYDDIGDYTELFMGQEGAIDKCAIFKYKQGNGNGTGLLQICHWGDYTTTQSIAIKKGGYVGIGTTTPSVKLDVVGNIKVSNEIRGTGNQLDLYGGNSPAESSGYIELRSGGTIVDGSNLEFRTGSTTNSIGTARMYITGNGNVGIGTKTPSVKLDVSGNIKVSNEIRGTDDRLNLYSKTDASQSSGYIELTSNKTVVAGNTIEFRPNSTSSEGTAGYGNTLVSISTAGKVEAVSFNATSDIRHKENIHELENALDKILSIRGVNFTFIDDDEKHLHAGIIAQEVQPIIPELIDTTNDDKWTANYDGLTPYLIESVKTLSKDNETIKQDNKELKDKIKTLETKIDLIMQQLNP